MELEKTKVANAHLKDWDGPFYPDGATTLSGVYDIHTWSGGKLEAVARGIHGFARRESYVDTIDENGFKFSWFCGLDFGVTESGRLLGKSERLESASSPNVIRVLFPHKYFKTSDYKCISEHLIAVYTRGTVSQEVIDFVVMSLINSLSKGPQSQRQSRRTRHRTRNP